MPPHGQIQNTARSAKSNAKRAVALHGISQRNYGQETMKSRVIAYFSRREYKL